MKKAILFSFSTVLILTSCGDPAQPETVIQDERIPVELTIADLFKGNKILAFLENEEKHIQESNEFFLKGLNSFRNKNDLDSAEHYLRMSILKEPTPKAYFELANVNMNKKDYETALLAYGVAEQLDYQPLSKIMYNKSCLYSLKGEQEMAGQYLEYALQSGYNNLDHINKDKDLEELRKSGYYERAIDKGLRGMSNAENLYWLQFKKMFAKSDLPQVLSPVLNGSDYEKLSYISYDYEKYISEMRDEQFSREVSKGFYYYSQPYETEDFVAVVYVVKDEFMGEYAPSSFVLATFTHEGKLIDKRAIAGGEYLDENFWEATLRKNRKIAIDIVKPIYEKDTFEHGFYDNKLIDTKKVGKIEFEINKKGEIKETYREEFETTT